MFSFSIKIALAVSAFAVAILAVSDLKSVKEAGPGEKTPWYRRLTIWGVVKIVLAAVTLGLGGMNEYLSAESSADATTKEAELQRKISDQQLKLADARAALSSVAAKLDTTSRTIDLIDKTARNERVLEGVYQASMSPMSGITYDFVNHQGAKYRPIRDDKIEFNLICRGGPTPTLSSCSVGNYGYLIADGDKFPLTIPAGSYIFHGSSKTGDSMSYEAPTSDCAPLRQRMEDALCEIDLDTARKRGVVELSQMAKEGFPFDSGMTDAPHDDLCRAYDILYGRTCEQDMPRNDLK